MTDKQQLIILNSRFAQSNEKQTIFTTTSNTNTVKTSEIIHKFILTILYDPELCGQATNRTSQQSFNKLRIFKGQE